jgi:CRP-like cAMP-binding protein
MIGEQDLLKLLKTNSLFKSVPEAFLKSFIKPKNFFIAKEGTLFYSADDEANEMYLIIEGEVKIKYSDQKNVEHRYLQDFFGEKEILDKSNRISYAIADRNCKLYRISVEEINLLIQYDEIMLNNLKKINTEELVESV